MVETEGRHRSALVARRAALFSARAPRIEISVAADGVEGPEVDDDDLPTTARGALEVGVAAERRAEAFYGQVAPTVKDPAVRDFLLQLMREEADHAALLEREIAALGPAAPTDEPRPRAGKERSARRSEAFPDRRTLEDALPRFDAATRVIAAGVIVHGLGEAQIAAALGVLRSTVSRKLSAFLAIARRQAAAGVAAATLVGCVGTLPDGHAAPSAVEHELHAIQEEPLAAEAPADVPSATPAVPQAQAPAPPAAPAEVARPERPRRRDARDELAARVHEQVASRMTGHDPTDHERIASVIVAEAKRAALDPFLVLALIHVESSFNPVAVSSAGAVGLMQLLEPTMRSELERAKLPAADPRDPVANVQAGVRYLRRLIDAFGDLDVALMAYNAGPNRIRGHMRNGEIPERFHVYPERVNRELARLRLALGGRPSPGSVVATSDGPPRPRG
jgi:soluble lytic murein transglycosylase-like protein